MPIYEYACSACGREIEKLVRQSSPHLSAQTATAATCTRSCRLLPPSPVRLRVPPACRALAGVAATLMVREHAIFSDSLSRPWPSISALHPLR